LLTVVDTKQAKALSTLQLEAGRLEFQEAYAIEFWVRADGKARIVFAHPPSILDVDVGAASFGKPQPLPVCK